MAKPKPPTEEQWLSPAEAEKVLAEYGRIVVRYNGAGKPVQMTFCADDGDANDVARDEAAHHPGCNVVVFRPCRIVEGE